MSRFPLLILLLIFSQVMPLRAEEVKPARLPVPSREERDRAFHLMRQAFERETTAASAEPQRMAGLIDQMYATARMESAKPAEQIVLFQQGVSYAVSIGDAQRALQGVWDIGERFQVDTLTYANQQLDQVRRNIQTDDQRKILAEAYLQLTGMALLQEKYDIAEDAVRRARAAVPDPRANQALVDRVTRIQGDVREIQRMAVEANRAANILQRTPRDPIASATYGRFRCLYLADWEEGLKYLQQSNDETLKRIAMTELANPTQPESQISLADAWWAYAEGRSGVEERQARHRAAYWYQTAHPNTTGLERRKVESRIQEFAQQRRKHYNE